MKQDEICTGQLSIFDILESISIKKSIKKTTIKNKSNGPKQKVSKKK